MKQHAEWISFHLSEGTLTASTKDEKRTLLQASVWLLTNLYPNGGMTVRLIDEDDDDDDDNDDDHHHHHHHHHQVNLVLKKTR